MLSVGVILVAVVADVYSVESLHTSLKASGMSLVKTEKSKGPSQLPWGIPDSILDYVGEASIKEHHPNREARGWQHHVVGVLCCRRDWCTSQNVWHHEIGK